MTERQKGKLLYYISRLEHSAFGEGLQRGAEMFALNGRNLSSVDYGERHKQDLEQLLSFVDSLCSEGEEK